MDTGAPAAALDQFYARLLRALEQEHQRQAWDQLQKHEREMLSLSANRGGASGGAGAERGGRAELAASAKSTTSIAAAPLSPRRTLGQLTVSRNTQVTTPLRATYGISANESAADGSNSAPSASAEPIPVPTMSLMTTAEFASSPLRHSQGVPIGKAANEEVAGRGVAPHSPPRRAGPEVGGQSPRRRQRSTAVVPQETNEHDARLGITYNRPPLAGAAADGRVFVDKWDCLLLLQMLLPLDCASSATEAAVDYFRTTMAVIF